jgi:hypothetical protein
MLRTRKKPTKDMSKTRKKTYKGPAQDKKKHAKDLSKTKNKIYKRPI